ncbi:MFS transporter [Longimycelium tulufanense]|uniref:MFS transporter n=1 Tax=Longimycelium tulufanense TaxID=907463 RepID=UPI00166B7848|nr:MFS transporter [Longimycelium tulufanense]
MSPGRLIPPGVLMIAVSYGLARYTYGLFVPGIRAELDLSTRVLGLIASGSYASFLLASAVTAVIAARTGPRLPVVIGAVTAAGGMLLIGLSHSTELLALGVILAGASPGWAYTPFSDAVVRLVPRKAQDRTYAIINSGTGFGVLVAGPVALWMGTQWRSAWIVFAVLALAAALWNGLLLPSGAHRSEDPAGGAAVPKLRWSWLVGKKSVRLFAVAVVLGISTSAYWTFAVDAITRAQGTGGGDTATLGPLFWTVVGVAGIGGAVAGDAVQRLGLHISLAATVFAIAVAIALLAALPTSWPAVICSAVLFGIAFIAVTGILGVWSIAVFRDRPSAGFGTTFFLISLGQFVGPSLFAVIAGATSLRTAFTWAAVITLAVLVVRPGALPSPPPSSTAAVGSGGRSGHGAG